MRYITNADGYLVSVSFGADVECDWGCCTEYDGDIPAGYSSVEAWYVEEAEQLYRWKIVNGSLVYDIYALPPEEPEVHIDDVVIEQGIYDGWHYRKWRSGYCELWSKIYTRPTQSIADGNVYHSEIMRWALPFKVNSGVVTGSAHYLHMVSDAEVNASGSHVALRLVRGNAIVTDKVFPVQLTINGSWLTGGLIVKDDGAGNVTITTYGDAVIEDDGAGNVNIAATGSTSITDDGADNVIII